MKISLSLHINDVNAILKVLGKLPYEQVSALIDDIRSQVQKQTQKPEEPPTPLRVIEGNPDA